MTTGQVVNVLILLLCCYVNQSLSLYQRCSGPALCHVAIDYPDHFVITKNIMLVGSKNKIYKLGLNFKLLGIYTSSSRLSARCRQDSRNEVTDCHNYYRSIILPSGNKEIARGVTADKTFIACGTNYYRPSCQYRQISNLVLVRKHVGTGFCPERANVPTAFVESSELSVDGTIASYDETLWVGTVIRYAPNGFLSQSQQPFNGIISLATIIDSGYWLRVSSFVDMYERGEYVYAFFKETPVELNPSTVRSRVARVCKKDAGHHLGNQKTYQTFIKSTIRCAVKDVETAEERYRNVPFYFDDLHDTALVESGSYNQLSTVRQTQLYAVFENSANGPIGSVVCVYTLDHMTNDVTRVFRGDYLRRFTSPSTWQRADNNNPFTCDTGRSIQEAENDIIMYNDVEQANSASYPLYLKDGQRFHKIVVGQVTGLEGVVYEVMFIAAEDKEGNFFITKVSYVEGRVKQRTVEHDVLILDQSDRRINHMQYHEKDDGQDMVYISTPNRLYRMNPSYCASYRSCGSCVASMDPYCVYDTVKETCVGINSANQNAALQNVTGGVAEGCPGTATASPTRISPTSSNLRTASNDDEEEGDPWKWAIVGSVIGLCMGIAIGVSFMFLLQRGLRSWHERQAKSDAYDASSSRGSGGPGNNNLPPSTNYTTITNEISTSEYTESLNSSAVNESFELTGIKRTDSFTSLSPLVKQ